MRADSKWEGERVSTRNDGRGGVSQSGWDVRRIFSAVMARTFIGLSIFFQSEFHSGSEWERTSFTQIDPILDPTIETTSSVYHQLKSIYMKMESTDNSLKMPTAFPLWKRIQVHSSVQVSEDGLLSFDCRSVRLWMQNEVVLLDEVDRWSWFHDRVILTQCSMSFILYVMWCGMWWRSMYWLKWCLNRSGNLIGDVVGWYDMLLFNCSACHVLSSLCRCKTHQSGSFWSSWVCSGVHNQGDIGRCWCCRMMSMMVCCSSAVLRPRGAEGCVLSLFDDGDDLLADGDDAILAWWYAVDAAWWWRMWGNGNGLLMLNGWDRVTWGYSGWCTSIDSWYDS